MRYKDLNLNPLEHNREINPRLYEGIRNVDHSVMTDLVDVIERKIDDNGIGDAPRRIRTDEEDCIPADELPRTLSRNSLKKGCRLRSERGFGRYTKAKMRRVVPLRWFSKPCCRHVRDF